MATLAAISTGVAGDLAFESADFRYEGATIVGNGTSDGSTALYFETPQGPGSFDWHLAGSRVLVNVSRQEYVEYTKPPNFNESHGAVATGPENYFRQEFRDGLANSTSRNADSYVGSITANNPSLSISAVSGSFQVGLQPPSRSQTIPQQINESPFSTTWVTANHTIIEFRGSFSLYIWDAIVEVRNETSNASFESGNHFRGVGPPAGQGHPVRNRTQTEIRIEVVNGTFTLRTEGRDASVATTKLELEGRLNATFSKADGTTRQGGRDEPLKQDLLTLADIGHLETWNPGATPPVLRARVLALKPPIELPTKTPEAEQHVSKLANPPQESSLPMVATLSTGFLGISLFCLIAVRRRGAVTVDDVEWALIEKDQRRAVRLGARLVRKNSADPTAVFLYATSMLGNADRKLLKVIEPLATRLRPGQRIGVAYVLARAAHAVKDQGRAGRWAKEASREKALRMQLVRDGILPAPPNWTQSGYS